MPPAKNPLVRLYHIRDEIDGIAEMLRDVDYGRYTASYPMVRTVERALQIISEAAKALPNELLDPYPQADWGRIRSIGNLLRHEYHHVESRQLWLIATEKLPQLRPIVEAMIENLENPPSGR